MDINKLLNGVDCVCGRQHTCPIRYVYIEKGAAQRLTTICAAYESVLLVADENTFAAAGEQVLAALSEKTIQKVIFPGKTILVPNETAIQAVENRLEGVELIVGIGSGVVQDLCKYVSHFRDIPYVIVATAPSMDGYASSGAAMITGGMKVTYPAGLPMAILADTAVLAGAPMEMLQAGYGDIIGKFSALNDWKLSHLVNGEYFCPYIYDLTMEQVERTLQLADGIINREEDSVKTLMEALVVIGILMSFAGSSRPASGSEHHLSHFFEITGILEGSQYFSHGIDVAYSTVITAALRERIAAQPFAAQAYRTTKEQYEQTMNEVYGSIARDCMELQQRAGNYSTQRTAVYLEREEEIRKILREMPGSKEIEKMLSRVGLDMSAFYKMYGESKINRAILYAKELKDRYTVLWMNYDFFGGEQGE